MKERDEERDKTMIAKRNKQARIGKDETQNEERNDKQDETISG